MYYVYLLMCADHTIYVGMTNDPLRRLREHNGLIPGKSARYTRTRRPCVLLCSYEVGTRGEALSEESRVKKLDHKAKLYHALDKSLGGNRYAGSAEG